MSAAFEARLYDGHSARAQTATVRCLSQAIELETGSAREQIGFDLLRRELSPTSLTLHRTDSPDWRLVLKAEAADDFAGVQKLHAMTGRHWRMIGGTIAIIGAVSALLWVFGGTIVAAAAPLVPRSVSKSIGNQYAAILVGEDGRCSTPAGEAALAALVARVSPKDGFVEPVRVRVTNSETVNAITLPGGEVLVFKGLLDASESPEELAGVIAHEFGHVQHYHGNQALIRHFGVGVFLEGLGGNLGSIASTGLMLSNTRAAEREADDEAVALMRQGSVSPLGLSAFFDRMGSKEAAEAKSEKGESAVDGLTSLLATHPGDADRKALFAAAARAYAAKPVLDDSQWQALKSICTAKPVAKSAK